MNINKSKKTYREFGIVLGIFIPLIFGFLIPFLYGHNFKLWTILVGLIFLNFAFFAPHKLSLPYKKWIQLGNLLAHFNSYIILGSIFIFILIPTSLIMKFTGYDPLKLNKYKKINTYREIRNNVIINFEKLF